MFHRRQKRRAVAAVEFAFLTPILLILLFGLWQIGRIVEVMQLMNNAAREGARLASQAQIINQVGAFTQIHASSGLPNVQDTVREYLIGNGVISASQVNDVTVTFQFLDGDLSRTDPYQGLQGERFQITVTLPVQDVNWTPFSTSGTLVASTVWVILVDTPFTVNTSVPGWSP
ncbi:MAG TPA: TadE family protein [Gemmataceae bacterium]|nr:TadE family protein [Gemmataceae bacterium]